MGGLPLVERGLGAGELCPTGGGLQEQVAEQEAGVGAVRPYGLVLGEAALQEPGEELLDDLEAAQRWPQPGCCRVSRGDEGEGQGVVERELAHVVRHPLEEGLPAVGGLHARAGVDLEPGDEAVDDAFEEVLAAVDVAVERHGLDSEPGAEPAHRQRVDALGVDERDGLRDDALPGQALAVAGAALASGCAAGGRHEVLLARCSVRRSIMPADGHECRPAVRTGGTSVEVPPVRVWPLAQYVP